MSTLDTIDLFRIFLDNVLPVFNALVEIIELTVDGIIAGEV